MKYDKNILVALVILILLVGWLLILSLQRVNQNNNLIQQIQQLKLVQSNNSFMSKNINGKIPVRGVDYVDGSNGSSCSTAQLPTGSQVNCTDGTQSIVTNGSTPVLPILAVPKDGQPGGSGITGATGLNNYELWMQAGNEGTLDDFLAYLKGDSGPSGRTATFQCNPLKLQNEWQYVGDSIWHPLDKVTACAS